jgi:chaperone BCS1
MSSIVLQPGVKDMLLDDCKDFMNSQDWYAERGIPFRRGYLLYGVPGSGKTSLIHSLAGELGLDIYVLSLSAKGMSDDQLGKLMNQLPSKSVVLLEDLDAAFTRATNRDEKSTGSPDPKNLVETKAAEADGSTLTLSGLLNAMDGVAAAEGRLLFATTNHLDRLDAALSRPGRLDVWVGFANATQWQAEGIFKCFFPIAKKVTPVASTSTTSGDTSQKNVPGSKRKKMGMAICPPLEEEELSDLAKKFAAAIPEDELSVASLQGYLLKNKSRPRECVDEAAAWVISERETREKLAREKTEREAKAALELKEAEEKAKKEKEATEAKEKAEKEATLAAEKKEARNKLKAYIKSEAAKKEGESTKVAEASDSSAGSSTPGESTSGADADTESNTSDEEATPASVDAQIKEAKSDKWVSVPSVPAAATPEPATATGTP